MYEEKNNNNITDNYYFNTINFSYILFQTEKYRNKCKLYQNYKQQGLSDKQIDDILVLDVKDHSYFTSQGVTDEHAGLGLFAYDEDVMNWVFGKTRL